MSILEIILIAFGLSMDAFAVSVTLGLSMKKPKPLEVMIPGAYFGFFQAIMPVAGYFAGYYFAGMVEKFEHWIAFALLALIGAKMIKDSFSGGGEERPAGNVFNPAKMLMLAVATSIDALAVGVTFAFYRVNILTAAMVTGLITFFVSMCGVKIGNIFGSRFRSKAEFVGGAVLVLLGVKFVADKYL
jgi:putative Mn2+ efflux pump MntP